MLFKTAIPEKKWCLLYFLRLQGLATFVEPTISYDTVNALALSHAYGPEKNIHQCSNRNDKTQ
jgi:hypothetical protein